MLDKIGNVVLALFGGVVTLAIISVIISRKSQAPAVIQAASSALANVVASAVNPVHTSASNGNLGGNLFTNPGGTTSQGLFSPPAITVTTP